MSKDVSKHDREMALRIANGVLDGTVDMIAGCRRILDYRSVVPGVSDESWDVIIAIVSETDDVPVGDVRDMWNVSALAAKEADAAAYVERVRPAAREAFAEIVRVALGA